MEFCNAVQSSDSVLRALRLSDVQRELAHDLLSWPLNKKSFMLKIFSR